MKFELLEPGEWVETAPEPGADDTDPETAGQERAPGPGPSPAQRLSAQVRRSAAPIGDTLARLAHTIEEHRAELAASGQSAAPAPPPTFRADRFAARPAASGPEGAA